MPVETVKSYFASIGTTATVIELPSSSATVALAAEALGVQPERIAKTVGLYGPEPGTSILLVVAGDARIHNGSFKREFGLKAKMLAAEDVEVFTGHPIGGVCPFANPDSAAVYLDESLRRFDTVFPAAGGSNSTARVTLDQLEILAKPVRWVDVCAGWRADEGAVG